MPVPNYWRIIVVGILIFTTILLIEFRESLERVGSIIEQCSIVLQ